MSLQPKKEGAVFTFISRPGILQGSETLIFGNVTERRGAAYLRSVVTVHFDGCFIFNLSRAVCAMDHITLYLTYTERKP